MRSFLTALARGVFILIALLKIMVTCRNQSLSALFEKWIKRMAESNSRSKPHPRGAAWALLVLLAGPRWSARRSSQLCSPRHPVVSLSSGNKWLIFCVYKLLLFIGCFISPPISFALSKQWRNHVPYSTETRPLCKCWECSWDYPFT